MLNLRNLYSEMDLKLYFSLFPSVNMIHSGIFHTMVQVELRNSTHAAGFSECIGKEPEDCCLLFHYVSFVRHGSGLKCFGTFRRLLQCTPCFSLSKPMRVIMLSSSRTETVSHLQLIPQVPYVSI
jgi:hypothetical protein